MKKEYIKEVIENIEENIAISKRNVERAIKEKNEINRIIHFSFQLAYEDCLTQLKGYDV